MLMAATDGSYAFGITNQVDMVRMIDGFGFGVGLGSSSYAPLSIFAAVLAPTG